MNEQEFEKLAAQTRRRLLRIWDGDAKMADEQICRLMRYYRDVAPAYGISKRDAQRVLDRVASLIQR